MNSHTVCKDFSYQIFNAQPCMLQIPIVITCILSSGVLFCFLLQYGHLSQSLNLLFIYDLQGFVLFCFGFWKLTSLFSEHYFGHILVLSNLSFTAPGNWLLHLFLYSICYILLYSFMSTFPKHFKNVLKRYVFDQWNHLVKFIIPHTHALSPSYHIKFKVFIIFIKDAITVLTKQSSGHKLFSNYLLKTF